jgi:hypothetical protein
VLVREDTRNPRFGSLPVPKIGRESGGRQFFLDWGELRFPGKFRTVSLRPGEGAGAVVDFGSENGDFLRRVNPDFDGIAIDPRDFYMDLVTDHNAFIHFSR